MMKNTSQDWVELVRVMGDPEAKVITGLLESFGVSVRIVTLADHALFPFTVDGLGEVRILVPESEFDAARALLLEQGQRPDEPEDHTDIP